MGVLSWLVFGLIAGAIAKFIHRGPDPGGWIVTIIIGILGAFLGGWLFNAILGWETQGWTLYGFISAIVGAIILLALYRLLTTRRA